MIGQAGTAGKISIIEGFFIFVDEDKGLGRSRRGEVRVFLKNEGLNTAKKCGRILARIRTQPTVHRKTAGPGIRNRTKLNDRPVRRAFVNIKGFYIGINEALWDKICWRQD